MPRRSWIVVTLIVSAPALLWWRYAAFTRDFSLWGAAFYGPTSTVTVRRLLDRGANPDASWQGVTALGGASFRGDDATALLLLAHGADPHRAWPQALHSDHPRILEAMLAHGLSCRGKEGASVFLRAVALGDIGDVNVLLKAGADPHAVEPITGRTALQVVYDCTDATKRGHIKRLLRRAGLH